MGSRGLIDRVLELKPEVTQGCWFESRLRQEVSTTEVRPLSKAPNPQPPHSRLPTAPLGWVKCREHISLLIMLCIIMYVTNKAHLSLIFFNAEVREFNSQLGGDYSIESGAIVDEKQPYIVAIFVVNVSEWRVQDLRDGIISRPIWPIGKLKRVQSSRDGGTNVVLTSPGGKQTNIKCSFLGELSLYWVGLRM